MTFTIKDLDHILRLCSIEMSADEKQKFLTQIDGILDFVGQLQEIDVEGVEPLTHPLESKTLEPREGIKEFEYKEDLLKPNVRHDIKNNGIVIKSPIKS